MTTENSGRRVLVVGGTGMASPLCRALPSHELILAARFVSNAEELEDLPAQIQRVPLDYRSERSTAGFLERLEGWNDLDSCVLWVHSPAHDFSRGLIDNLSRRQVPPQVVHVFGSSNSPSDLAKWAAQHSVLFTAVQLGRVETPTGWRWLTHTEISGQAAAALSDTYPGLRVS